MQTKWDQEDNSTRLAERMDEVDRWKELLEIALCDINAEIDALSKVSLYHRLLIFILNFIL